MNNQVILSFIILILGMWTSAFAATPQIANTACNTVVLKADGTIWAWGTNVKGELGDGTTTWSSSPIQVGIDSDWKSIATGTEFTIAIKNNGTIWGWGSNEGWVFGSGASDFQLTPIQIGSDTDWKTATAGRWHVAAIKTDGTLWTWGNNNYGQLGVTGNPVTAIQVGVDNNWKTVAAGDFFTLAIKADGTLWSWGHNGNGQLGIGTTTNAYTPMRVGTDNNWQSIAAGWIHSIATKTDSTLWAWGDNFYAQLGDGTKSNKNIPVKIGSDAAWSKVSAGAFGSAALKNDGSIWSWGGNKFGQLGSGTLSELLAPSKIGNENNWSSVDISDQHSSALKADGTVWTWGRNYYGQLGDGNFAIKHNPVKLGNESWKEIGTFKDFTYGIKSDSTLWTWGHNDFGQLGDGSLINRRTPVQVGTAANWNTLAAGAFHGAAFNSNGELWIWGKNDTYQLGDGTTASKTSPIQAGAAGTWLKVSTGYTKTVAIKTDGTLWEWGGSNTIPTQLDNTTTWAEISSGYPHSLAVKSDGTLWAWGTNSSGSFGDGNYSGSSALPVRIGTDSNWRSVAAGMENSFAIKSDGTLWAWGYNHFGELGAGGTTYIPVKIGTANTWKSVSTGGNHAVAIRTDGTLWVWGYNNFGELGNGTRVDSNIPIQVGSASNWKSALAGQTHTVALQTDGSLWIWGNNDWGTLGDGSAWRETPGMVPGFVQFIYITLTTTPLNYSNQASGTIAFSANETATFQCKIDNGTFTNCTSPFSYSNLANGQHTVSIKATDGAGNTSTSNHTWTVNTVLAASSAILLPQTGQTKCYNASGTEIACAGTGQDGDILAGATQANPLFTDNGTTITDKIYGMTWQKDAGTNGAIVHQGISGPATRFTDNADGTQTDNMTGLVWLKNAGCFDAVGGITKGTTAGTSYLSWENAITWSNALANGKCGLTDGSTVGQWRLPNVDELASLPTNYTISPRVWLQERGFINIGTNDYWSSNSYAGGSGKAWAVFMNGNFVGNGSKANTYYVWPVRGGYIQQKLTVTKAGSGVGTVTPNTGTLTWVSNTGTTRINPGDTVTLTATPDSGSTFSGWSGACTGTSTCQVTMDTAKSVTATFVLPDTTPPALASGVSATNLNTFAGGDIRLNWTNPVTADFNHVNIYYSTSAIGTEAPAATNVTGTTYKVSGLTTGTQYFFVIRTVDNTGNETTNTLSHTIVRATPTKATITLTSSITGLTKQGSTVLTYSTTTGTVTLTRNGTPITTPSGGTLTLLEGRNTIIASATDAAGNIGTATVIIEVDTMVMPPTINATPTTWGQNSYIVTGQMENGSTVTLTSTGGTVAPITYPTTNTWATTITNLTNGTYTLTARATDAIGNISTNTTASLKIDITVPVPLTVTDTHQGGTIIADWSGYTGTPYGWNIYLSTTPYDTTVGLTPFKTLPSTDTTIKITGLTDNTTYYIAAAPLKQDTTWNTTVTTTAGTPTRQGIYGTVTDSATNKPLASVQATIDSTTVLTDNTGTYIFTGLAETSHTITFSVDRYSNTTTSATVTAGTMTQANVTLTQTQPPAPQPPTALTATAGDTRVTLTWNPVTDPELNGYNIYRDSIKINPGTITTATYTDSGLINNTTYSYYVTTLTKTPLESTASSTVQATPASTLPLPPNDLTATLNCDGTVTLTWTKPASTNLLGYYIYQNTGTTATYSSYTYKAGATTTSHTTATLIAGQTYTFAARTVGTGEETNTTVTTTISIPATWNTPKAAITIPKTGKKVSGNNLHVQAEPLAANCGTPAPAKALFQYKPTASGTWINIPSANINHPNPDTSAPYFTKWDVTGLIEGDYNIRAVSSTTTTDASPAFITVTVDHGKPEIKEDEDSTGQNTASGSIEKGRDNTITTGSVQVTFPDTSLVTDATLTVTSTTPETTPAGSLGNGVHLNLTSGQSQFATGITVTIPYTDKNNDGIIDGTGIFAVDAQPKYYNTNSQQWEELTDVTTDITKKVIKGTTTHFSLFGLGKKAAMTEAQIPGTIFQTDYPTTDSYSIGWEVRTAGMTYELQQATDAAFTINLSTVYTGTGNIAEVTPGQNGTYYYRLRALKQNSNPSNWRTSGKPVNLTLTCDAPSQVYLASSSASGIYDLGWAASRLPGVTYDIEQDSGSGYSYYTSSTSNRIALNNMPNGSYSYRVKTRKAGYADSSWAASIKTSVARQCSKPVQLYYATSSASSSFSVGWSPSSTAAVTYIIEESISGGPFNQIGTATANSIQLNNKTNGTYAYRIRATKSGYLDSANIITNIITVTATCPAISQIFQPASSSNGTFEIGWLASPVAPVTYVIEENINGAGWNAFRSQSSNLLTVTGKANGSYMYRVKVQKGGYAESGWKTATAIPVLLTTGAPVTIYIPTTAKPTFEIGWSHSPQNPVTYIVEESYNGGAFTQVASQTSNLLALTGKAPGPYRYRVKAQKGGGWLESGYKTSGVINVVP